MFGRIAAIVARVAQWGNGANAFYKRKGVLDRLLEMLLGDTNGDTHPEVLDPVVRGLAAMATKDPEVVVALGKSALFERLPAIIKSDIEGSSIGNLCMVVSACAGSASAATLKKLAGTVEPLVKVKVRVRVRVRVRGSG